MTRTRLGLLGLCAIVFGMMAFGAGAAQAEVGAKWLILNSTGELKTDIKLEPSGVIDLQLEATVGLEAVTTGVLHSKIAGIAVLFECTTLTTVNATLKAQGSIGTGAKIKFSGCITKLNNVTSIPCEPNAGGKEKGVINTNAGHGLIVLHVVKDAEGKITLQDDLVSILPDNIINGKGESEKSEIFAVIEMGEECAIGSKVPVIGKATLKDCSDRLANEKGEKLEINGCEKELFLTHLVKHQVEIGPLTELWTISKTAEHVATILGSALAFLTGAHTGLKFSGDPA